MAIQWGLLGGNNALAAFNYGAQLGQQVIDRQEAREHRNALLDLQRGRLEQDRFETQSRMDAARMKAEQEQMEAGRKAIANAAFDIIQTPDPAQRAAKWDAYVQRFNMPDLVGQYSDQRLNEIVAQADLQKEFQEFQNPRYQVIPEGGMLVNTRDPSAVQSVSGGAVPPPPAGFVLDDGGPASAPGNFPLGQ